MVLEVGVEPTRHMTREPKSRTSANSVIPAYNAQPELHWSAPMPKRVELLRAVDILRRVMNLNIERSRPGAPSEIRTRDTNVKGWGLNHLSMGA